MDNENVVYINCDIFPLKGKMKLQNSQKKMCKSGRNTFIQVTAPERQNVRYDTEHYVKIW